MDKTKKLNKMKTSMSTPSPLAKSSQNPEPVTMNKLKVVLEGLLRHGNKPIRDHAYLEKVISHLNTRKEESEIKDILKAQYLQDWIKRSISQLNTEQQNPQVYAFTLRMLALLIENEWQFMHLMETNLIGLSLSAITKTPNESNQPIKLNPKLQIPSIILAHVQVLRAMLKHTVGIYWMVSTKSWLRPIEYCLQNQTIYVVRESKLFVSEFLFIVATTLNDENVCAEILNQIIAPLDEIIEIRNETVFVDSSDLQRVVNPPLTLMMHIMEHFVLADRKTCVPNIILNETRLKIHLWRLTDMTKDHFFFRTIMKTITLLNFTKFIDTLGEKNPSLITFNQNHFGLTFFNHMKLCLYHRSAPALMSISKLYHSMWTLLGDRVPEVLLIENNTIKFENQIIVVQLLPILATAFQKLDKKMEQEEPLDSYIRTLFDISSEHTMRICYAFRDLLEKNLSILPDIAAKSIEGIIAMKNHLHRDRAVYVFQAFMYSLKDFAFEHYKYDKDDGIGDFCDGKSKKSTTMSPPTSPTSPTSTSASASSSSSNTIPPQQSTQEKSIENEKKSDMLIDRPNLLSALLTGLHALVKEYRISWKDSIESVCLVNFMLTLLEKPTLSTRNAVQALRLTQLSVEHFLAPNLALLVNDLKGSGLQCLGPMIRDKLHHPAWEVRDSALELVTSVANISVSKFPPFQRHILENDICQVTYSLAKNDSEPFVRASALRCLSEMVNIHMLWENSLSSMNLMEHLLNVVRTEEEGIVRNEAVNLICKIYKLHRIPNNHYEQLFPTMAQLAVNDLYWEVKVSALLFFGLVIHRQVRHYGVENGGHFPAVIFSKEHRKIITLTPKEILIQINKIMNELSTRGVLGIILECLADDCDVEVVKTANKLIEKLNNFLKKYNYPGEIKDGQLNATQSAAAAAAATTSSATGATAGPPQQPTATILISPTAEPMTNGFNELISLETPSSAPVSIKTEIENDDYTMHDNTNTNIDQQSQTVDQIIDSICSSDDINLLINSYQRQMNMNGIINNSTSSNKINIKSSNADAAAAGINDDDWMSSEEAVAQAYGNNIPVKSELSSADEQYFKNVAQIKPLEYWQRCNQINLDELLARRTDWLDEAESFDSLLDDIRFALNITDINGADCY